MRTKPFALQEIMLPPGRARQTRSDDIPPPMHLLGCPADALTVFRGLSIAVIGTGSLGSRIALNFARMLVGGLLLADPKSFRAASLATHDIINPGDIGKSKALLVGQRCKETSPDTRVLAMAGPVEALDLAALADVDLVVMAPDLLSVEVELGQWCMNLGKPLVQASQHGATLTSQVRFFGNATADGPCPACGYGPTEWDLLERQARFSCDGATDSNATAQAAAPATNSLGALSALTASLATLQILRFALNLGKPVVDTMQQYNAFTHCSKISPLARRPDCRLDHVRFASQMLDVPLASLSLAELSRRALNHPAPKDAQFEVAGFGWVEAAACGCGQSRPVRRFIPRAQLHASNGSCSKCSEPVLPIGFHSHRLTTAAILENALDQPLHKLGASHVTSVLVRTGNGGVLIRPPSAQTRP